VAAAPLINISLLGNKHDRLSQHNGSRVFRVKVLLSLRTCIIRLFNHDTSTTEVI